MGTYVNFFVKIIDIFEFCVYNRRDTIRNRGTFLIPLWYGERFNREEGARIKMLCPAVTATVARQE